ncbi:MAG TPA: glycosyltransferase family 4 protein [Burkholderiales bacterium]|nr:glycosyltransferase family 4 protein [Burkholderiales bacterium]
MLSRKRVCFVAPRAWPVLSGDAAIPIVGGAEVQQSLLARLLAAHGHRVSMICLDYGQPQRARVDGIEVIKTFGMTQGLPMLRFLHPRVTSMWRAMREVDAEIYYFRSASMWLGVLAEFCRRHGRRSIYAGASNKDFVADVGGQLPYLRDRWLYRRGLAQADRIVAQNEAQRASLRATHGRDAVVIPSCYQAPARRGAAANPAARDRVLWVGTVHENKRPELFLELAARLPHRRFVLIGGPRPGGEAFYERIRAQAAAAPNVEATGFLPLAEVEPWFDRARVLVNTSTYEGMPNTFLQAWARGVPTVATVDVGAPVHQVVPNPEDLPGRVEAAFDNPALGARCREYFERNHSPAGVLARYEELFASL